MTSVKARIAAYHHFVKARKTSGIRLFSGGNRVFRSFLIPVLALLIIILLIAVTYVFIDPVINAEFFEDYTILKTAMAWTTDIGKTNWILIPTGIILLFMVFYDASPLSPKKRRALHQAFLKIYYVFSTIALSGLIALLFKNLIGRARPPYAPDGTLWISYPFRDIYEYASFPSGHSTTIAALAVSLSLLFPKLRYPMLLLAIWVGMSRIVLGVHYPSDVLTGLMFGGFFAWFWAFHFAKHRFLFNFKKGQGLILRDSRTPYAAGEI